MSETTILARLIRGQAFRHLGRVIETQRTISTSRLADLVEAARLEVMDEAWMLKQHMESKR